MKPSKYRSSLEEKIAINLELRGIEFGYETKQIYWTEPSPVHKYTPDFILPNGIIIEAKGWLKVEDRKKHLAIKNEHPQLDIRFVFENIKKKIRKGSSTTYAMWATKHGFKFAEKIIPQKWLEE